MVSNFQFWLNTLEKEAEKEAIILSLKHYDVLDYYFKMGLLPEEAILKYKKDFLPRWNALNGIKETPTN